MSDNKSYRIKANVGEDSVLNINLNQDFKTFEILSLKFDSDNLYKFHTSNYGCVAGRVLANGNFGIPNAKISIFIKATEEDLSDAILSYLYPYKNTRTKNDDGIRYNLLPDQQLSDCHRNVGTFPNKRLVLDDNNVFEVYDKYYKYTTRSNSAGDFMIFGVPVGEQTIHVDIDLSDIGILSQRPRDMFYKGYNATQFENANMFKKDVNLDSLTQIISQNSNVYVYPFWGERTEGDVAITRKDIEIQYKFEPTCVFMGSIITDEKSNAISKNCVPSERMGKMDRLTTGNGTIEMIRKKPDGGVEELIVQGNQLIDGNGVWCYQIPMNLDYVCTDEYGNIVPTDDPKKGIPTRTRARFRMSIIDADEGTQFSHGAKTLVPNNPQTEEEVDYAFGTYTLDDEFGTKSFRDLFWNQVYSVKSYIPRFQQRNYNRNKRFTGFKVINDNGSNNPLPYNNMRIDISFIFGLQCAIFHILLWIVGIYNVFMYHFWNGIRGIGLAPRISFTILGHHSWTLFSWYPFKSWADNHFKYLYIGDSFCPDLEGWYFAPKAEVYKGGDYAAPYNNAWKSIRDNSDLPKDSESIEYENAETNKASCFTNNVKYLTQCVEINLAMEYDVIQFDFYNDWINGLIYSPRWNADIRKKRSYLFGLIKIKPRLNACSEENFSSTRRMVQQCAMTYGWNESKKGYLTNNTNKGCAVEPFQRCHKAKGRISVNIFGSSNGGVVHKEQTIEGNNVYYYKPYEWRNGKRYPFFATDIILLGSLNENDGQGIPQTFKKLVSSTYQLPDPLAGTNIGLEGFLYGIDGVICNGSKKLGEQGIEVSAVENNFDNVLEWTKYRDDKDAEEYDDPKPITETSGIDWGISGPDQGSDDFNKLYYPGGHFLGISCFYSESNIKSCVNLSRVCELGSSISHRQTFITKDGNSTDNYQFVYTIPTGIISGDEILDFTGKNEFATLNYNRLRTRRSIENNLLEYDFKTIFPINFNGELNNKIAGNNSYTREYNSSTKEFIRTIEETNYDYYKFRLGITDEILNSGLAQKKIKEKYLSTKGENVSMPVYENSFYFYFGIHNGNTALDKFNKDFFTECPSMSIHEPKIKIGIEEGDACDIESNGKVHGKILLYTIGVISPTVIINGNNPRSFEDGKIEEISSFINKSNDVVDILSETKYVVEINGDNISTVSKELELGVKIPEDILDITFSVTDFKEKTFYNGDDFSEFCDTAVTGFIEFKNCETGTTTGKIVAVLISSDNYYHYLYKGNPSITLPASCINKTDIAYRSNVPNNVTKCYLWDGNINYDIYIKKVCDGGSYSAWIKYDMFSPGAPEVPDIVFDDNEDVTYKKVIEKWMKRQNASGELRIVTMLDDPEISDEIKYVLKKSLYFSKSKYDIDTEGEIKMEVVNPSSNVVISLQGQPETITEYDSSPSYLTINPYDFAFNFSNLSNILFPTTCYPKNNTYEGYFIPKWLLTENGEELDYMFNPASPFPVINKNNYQYTFRNWYYNYYINGILPGGVPIDTIWKNRYFLKYNGQRGICIDAPYLPYYFRAVFVYSDFRQFNGKQNQCYGTVAIANAIKNSDTDFYDVSMNDIDVKQYLRLEYKSFANIEVSNYNNLAVEDNYPIDVIADIDNNVYIKPLYSQRPKDGRYTVSVTDKAGRKISKTVEPHFIGDKRPDGQYYPFSNEKSSHIRYYLVNKDFIPGLYFTAFCLWDGTGPEAKYTLSDKRCFVTSYATNNAIYYNSPFFPKLGALFALDSECKIHLGPDWNRFRLWPYYATGSRQYFMWSTDYTTFTTESVRITENTDGNTDPNQLFTNFDGYNDDEQKVIGVYDPGNNSDPFQSNIVVIKEYTLSGFDTYRRALGLIP